MSWDLEEAKAESVVIFKRLEALREAIHGIPDIHPRFLAQLDAVFREDAVRDDPSAAFFASVVEIKDPKVPR